MPAERLQVEHRGGLLFHVSSESNDEKFYVVDLEAHRGMAECTCRDWQTRCSPRIKEGKPWSCWPAHERTCCKHAHAALLFLARKVVEETVGLNEKHAPATQPP